MLHIEVPPSKSYTQRALIMASLTPGSSVIDSPADCDDARLLVAALPKLGIPTRWDEEGITVQGGTLKPPKQTIELGNAGTAMRFTTALSALIDGSLQLDGVDAMRRRPMPGLLNALKSVGVKVEELGRPSCPPIRLTGPARPTKRIAIDPSGSSQQVSALIMVATCFPDGLTVELTTSLPSRPYVDMTLAVIEAFGGRCRWEGEDCLVIEPSSLIPTRFSIEADYSAAAMVLAGAWISGREITIRGLREDSKQGDRVFSDVLVALSRDGERTINLRDAPDVVPPAVAAALFAHGATTIEGVSHLRIKECDRLHVLSSELGKLGARIEIAEDSLTVRPGPLGPGATLDPHGDHRMAMAFGLVSLRVPGIEILDSSCISKSFSSFWDVLEQLK